MKRLVISLLISIVFLSNIAWANPTNGTVIAGNAQINGANTSRTVINQGSDKAIINWGSFNIAKGEVTQFVQPNSNSIILNRVVGGNPSTIFGQLLANGKVVIVNPQGVWFGPGSVINAASLIVSTANISNEDFMAANGDNLHLLFSDKESNQGVIVNDGKITVADHGLVALLAPGVENNGVITAKMGQVILASGSAFTLDFNGDQLINFQINQKVATKEDHLTDAQKRQMVMMTEKGNVLVTPAAAEKFVHNVVNMTGVERATGAIKTANGDIVLMGSDRGVVRAGGTIDVSGNAPGQKGGQVKILGDTVHVMEGAKIDASGNAGGGQILVGGGYQGKDGTPTARYTTVAANSSLQADALGQGNGGQVVIWSDVQTDFNGFISARGGQQGGNGGNAEVSSHGKLNYHGLADLRAYKGKNGTLLLDPRNVFIVPTGTTQGSFSGGVYFPGVDDSVLLVDDINNQLLFGNVTIQTSGSGGAQAGDIHIDAPIILSDGNNLSLVADRNIIFGNGGSITGNAVASPIIVTLLADQNPLSNGAIIFPTVGGTYITMNGAVPGSQLNISSTLNPGDPLVITGAGDSRISANSNTTINFTELPTFMDTTFMRPEISNVPADALYPILQAPTSVIAPYQSESAFQQASQEAGFTGPDC